MDFNNERGDNQPSLLKQPFAIFVWVFYMQAVDNRIVLTRKQRVHGRQPDPPIAVDGSELLVRIIISGLWIEGQMTGLVQMQLAVREKSAITAAHTVLHSEIGAVHLRCIPPMGGRVAVGRRPPLVRRAPMAVRTRSPDRHLWCRPIVAFRDGEAKRRIDLVIDAVT